MPEESSVIDSKVEQTAVEEVIDPEAAPSPTNGNAEEDEVPDSTNPDALAASSAAKKKKSKKAKLKKAFGVDSNHDEEASSSSTPASKLTNGMVEQLLEMNPSLKSEVAGLGKDNAAEAVRKMDVADLLTGMVGGLMYLGKSVLISTTVREREKSEGYGFVQILANAARASIRSVPGHMFRSSKLKMGR